MAITENLLGEERERSNWVKLRTLLRLRWIAILGQSAAMLVAYYVYELQFETQLALVAIGMAVLANIFFNAYYPITKRLSEGEAFAMLIIDILQLAFLLYVTGGLANPFALLVLAPVTIAATVLQLRSTLTLGMFAITLVSLLSQFSLPILTAEGIIIALPPLFAFGFWAALVVGISFLALYARLVTQEMHTMAEALLATQLALAREQKLTDLGGVVAATAHELGTPLATIKLVSSELLQESVDASEITDDLRLISAQADRCRDILQSMGRARKDDLHMRYAPFETVVREAAEPHINRGKTVCFDIAPENGRDIPQPSFPRRPEIIHGLRNLIQNGVDFAQSEVVVTVRWGTETLTVRIHDDGAGFPQSVIGRIGDPFVKRRRASDDRPGYDGMGLGLFIAKTLLERSGAALKFRNKRSRSFIGSKNSALSNGAIVEVTWPSSAAAVATLKSRQALGENKPIS